jgi:hypothetical protein
MGEAQFIGLPYAMVRHEVWRALSGGAVKVWLEIRARYTVRGDGSSNNGQLTLSLDEAARILHLGKATVARALQELVDAGLLVRTKKGAWYGRKATEWRVTDCPTHGQVATRDWQHRRDGKAKPAGKPSMFDADGVIRSTNAP